MTFEKNNKIAYIACIYSLDAIEYAARYYNIFLDFSGKTIQQVEHILDHLYKTSLVEEPSDAQKWQMAKLFGSYVGEIFRIQHGAKWGLIGEDEEALVAMELSGSLFWPWSRVYNRLQNGDEDNVYAYYKCMLGEVERVHF